MTDHHDALAGYRRFRDSKVAGHEGDWAELSKGQSPRAMIIACSDSRVDPATIFDSEPGEIFVVRNVANLVPAFDPADPAPSVSSALEFAVTQLKVSQLIVMGHAKCGGIGAALTGAFADAAPCEGGFVHRWVDQITPLASRIGEQHGTGPEGALALERASIAQSLAHLRSYPFVQQGEAAGTLELMGFHFSIGEGQLYRLDEASGDFTPA